MLQKVLKINFLGDREKEGKLIREITALKLFEALIW